MSNTSKHLHCDNCNTLTQTVLREIRLNRYGKDFYFPNTETETCPNCDNFYLNRKTINKCEQLIESELVVA